MIRLSLVSVGMVEDTGSVILVLRSAELARLLVIEVGLLEGRAIAMSAEGSQAPRPLTHDLMHDVILRLGSAVTEVRIRDFRERTFFADLVMMSSDGTQLVLDARPSDAIALALRFSAPIFTTEAVLAEAGLPEDGEEDPGVEDDDDDDDDEDEEAEENIIH